MLPLTRLLLRSNHYIPLDVDLDGSPLPVQKRRRPSFKLTAIVAISSFISVIINVVFLVGKYTAPPGRPVDDFQHLNRFPLVGQSPVAVDNHTAIVTTLYNDAYTSAVTTLGHSLRKARTSARMIVLYFPSEVSASSLCLATASGFEPVAVTRISPPHGGQGIHRHFLDQFTKLSLWTLDKMDIHSLVYLDADTLVVRNFDELFSLPYSFAAAPDVWQDRRGMTLEFNAGVLFLKPNSSVFQHMLDVLPITRFPAKYAEQAFLNQYFAASTVTLPIAYNGNLMTKQRYPTLWEGIQDELRIIHYNMAKPFVGQRFEKIPLEKTMERVRQLAEKDHGLYREEVLLWGQMWEETRTTYKSTIAGCLQSGAFAEDVTGDGEWS